MRMKPRPMPGPLRAGLLALCALLALAGVRPLPGVKAGDAPGRADAAVDGRYAIALAHARVLDATLRAAAPAPGAARVENSPGTGPERGDPSGHRVARTAGGRSLRFFAAPPPPAAPPARGVHALRSRALPFFHATAPPTG
jgi:hypothetical protein